VIDERIDKLLLAEIEPGRTHEEAPGGRGKTGDNITGLRGTSALYTLKRLKRDRPDLFQVVLGGDRRSKDFQIDNIKLKTKGGTSALLRRQRRIWI
jgi:hypothetical protein